MARLAVITPTWRPDATLFTDLHASVLEHTPDGTVHHVIVPAAHRSVFTRYAGPRCQIWTHPELLPRRYVRVPPGVWLNSRRPWPPVRGWVMQQAAKIAAAAVVDADVVLVADSDAVLVRPVDPGRLMVDDRPYLYRVDDAVHAGMERHVLWHHAARDLLGFPQTSRLPLPDYVTPIGVWDPRIVRAMQRRLTEVSGRHWLDALTARLHLSEFVIYGVFAETTGTPPTDPTLCLNYYRRTPLDRAAALSFAEALPTTAVGMMISGNSHTPQEVRHAAIRRCADIVASTHPRA